MNVLTPFNFDAKYCKGKFRAFFMNKKTNDKHRIVLTKISYK